MWICFCQNSIHSLFRSPFQRCFVSPLPFDGITFPRSQKSKWQFLGRRWRLVWCTRTWWRRRSLWRMWIHISRRVVVVVVELVVDVIVVCKRKCYRVGRRIGSSSMIAATSTTDFNDTGMDIVGIVQVIQEFDSIIKYFNVTFTTLHQKMMIYKIPIVSSTTSTSGTCCFCGRERIRLGEFICLLTIGSMTCPHWYFLERRIVPQKKMMFGRGRFKRNCGTTISR
mmetsp:Transcript_4335/g.6601  ORF Transcript_4335/g.6601 Transcript_4335/m.6601 type:complete len:225 (-) Transcript_4335:150-824(-)